MTLETQRETGGVRALAVHHVSINVRDVEAARRFYVDRLGLTERDDRPAFPFDGAWLDAGGQQVHLIEGDTPPNVGQHFALLFDDLDATVSELRAAGLDVADARPVGSGRQTFVNDPSGNKVELHQASRSFAPTDR